MGKFTHFLGTTKDLKWLIRRTAEVCPGVLVLGQSDRRGELIDPLKEELRDSFSYNVTNLTKEHQKLFGEKPITPCYTIQVVASHKRMPDNPDKFRQLFVERTWGWIYYDSGMNSIIPGELLFPELLDLFQTMNKIIRKNGVAFKCDNGCLRERNIFCLPDLLPQMDEYERQRKNGTLVDNTLENGFCLKDTLTRKK